MESEIEISSVWTNKSTNAIDLNIFFVSLISNEFFFQNRDMNKRGEEEENKRNTDNRVYWDSLETWKKIR